MAERNVLVDRLKGYACFLVLFGHVIMGIRLAGVEVPYALYVAERFIWSFHVALFLFLSGFVYKITGEWKSKKTKLGFIGYKFVNLAVPYVVFSAVYVLINSFAGSANTQFALSDLLSIWKEPIAQYWYLYALFFLLCIYAICSGIIKNYITTIILLVAGYILPLFGVSFGSFEFVIYSALAFGLGTFSDIKRIENLSLWLKITTILLHIALGIVLVYFSLIEKPWYKELMIIIGIISSIFLISLIQKSNAVSRFLDFVNKYSFQIYLLHTIFTAGIRIVLMKIGVLNWVVHTVVGCLFGLFCSVMVAMICEKIKIFNILFFPMKYIKKK